MAYTNTWDETAPADGDSAGLGDDNIRQLKLDARERLTTILDLTGTRTINTDPHELGVQSVDTVSVTLNALSSVQSATLAADYTHAAATNADWDLVSGLTLTTANLGAGTFLAHTNGAASAGVTDTAGYQIICFAQLLLGYNNSNSNNDVIELRIRNTTAGATIGPGATGNGPQTIRTQLLTGAAAPLNRQWLSFLGIDTGRTANQTYRIEFRLSDGIGGAPAGNTRPMALGAKSRCDFYVITLKR